MEIIESHVPVYVIMAPMVAIPFIAISDKRPNLREAWTIIASVTMFFIVSSMLPQVIDGKVIEYHLLTLFPGLDIKFSDAQPYDRTYW